MATIGADTIAYKINVQNMQRLSDLIDKVGTLGKGMTGLNRKLDDFGKKANSIHTKGINDAKESLNDVEKSADKATDKTNEFSRAAGKAGKSGNFNHQINGLNSVSSRAERASKAFNRFNGAGNRMAEVGRKTAISSLAIGAGLLKSANDAVKVQHTLRETFNLAKYGGENAAEAQKNVNKMQEDGNKYSVRYGVSQRKLADGYQELIKRGYSTNQALAAQKSLLQASMASGDDYNDVVHNSTAALESFGMRSNSTSKMLNNTKDVVNKMAYASDLTATDFQSMGVAMEYVGARAHQSGYSLSETASAIGILSNNGLEAQKAGTGLRKVMQSIQSPTKGGAAALESIGLSAKSFVDQRGNMKSVTETMALLNKQTQGMSKAKKGVIFHALFGATGENAGAILANSSKQLDELNKKVEKSTKNDYVGKLSKSNTMTAQSQIKIFQQSLNSLGIAFATTVLPNLNSALRLFDKLLFKINEMPKSQKKIVTWGIVAVGAIAPVSFALSGLLKTMGALKAAWAFIVPAKAAAIKAPSTLGGGIAPAGVAKAGGSIMGKVAAGASVAGAGIDIGASLYSAITTKNNTTRYKSYGKAVGTAIGTGVGMFFGGPAGAAIGATVGHVVGGWAGKAVHSFSRTKMGHKIGKVLSRELKPANKALNSLGKSASRNLNKNMPAIRRSMRSLGRALAPAGKFVKKYFVLEMKHGIRAFGHILNGAILITVDVVKALAGTFSGLFKMFKGELKLFNDFFTGRWGSLWGDAKTVFSGFGKAVGSIAEGIWNTFSHWFGMIFNLGKDVGNFVSDLMGKSGSKAPSLSKGLVKNNKRITNGIHGSGSNAKKSGKIGYNAFATIGAHAKGGVMSHSHLALVGENGVELGYSKHGARLLGTRGAQLTGVYAGEKIYPASDTKKMLNGGMGVRMYADGNAKLNSGSNSSSVKIKTPKFNKTERETAKSMKRIKNSIVGSYNGSTKNSRKIVNSFSSHSKQKWNRISKDTDKLTNRTKNNTVNDYSTMSSKALNIQSKLRGSLYKVNQGIASDFNSIFGKLDNYMASAMKNVIKQINRGDRAINEVLSKFGGGGSTLPTVSFATGSHGPIKQNTMAVVNDANSSQRQEAIVKKNGRVLMPQGDNVVMPLAAGDEVLNGHEVAALQGSGQLPHYAKGTGALKRLIKRNNANPNQAFNTTFGNNSKANGGTFLGTSVLNNARGAANKYGKPWSAEVWSQMAAAMSGSSNGGPVRHSPGNGWGVSSGFGNRGKVSGGFSSHDGVDFSGGKTVHAMNTGKVTHAGGAPAGWGGGNGIGQNVVISGGGLDYIYQELNGKANSGANLLVDVGDTVKAGQAIAKLGPSGSHVHVGATNHKMFSVSGSSTAGWLNPLHVKGKAAKNSKHDSRLSKLVKSEIGDKLKWVSKNLADDDDISGAGNIGGHGVTRWIPLIKKGAKEMGVHLSGSLLKRILNTMSHESGGNPTVWQHGYTDVNTGVDPARGLFQFIGSTFRNYAVKGHNNRASGYDQILALFNDKNLTSDLRWNGGWAPSGARRRHADGGWAENGKVNIFGEKGVNSEVAINPQKPNADPLIMEAMSARAKNDPAGIFGRMRNFAKLQRKLAEINTGKAEFNRQQQSGFKNSKQATTIRPQINYSPTINISGVSNDVASQVKKALADDKAMLMNIIDDYFNDALGQD
ncbi:tape measure protein [Lactobacillus phage 3-SAC12]|nr:tape measure protein [Lactobacillus phage 3-SAC12]